MPDGLASSRTTITGGKRLTLAELEAIRRWRRALEKPIRPVPTMQAADFQAVPTMRAATPKIPGGLASSRTTITGGLRPTFPELAPQYPQRTGFQPIVSGLGWLQSQVAEPFGGAVVTGAERLLTPFHEGYWEEKTRKAQEQGASRWQAAGEAWRQTNVLRQGLTKFEREQLESQLREAIFRGEGPGTYFYDEAVRKLEEDTSLARPSVDYAKLAMEAPLYAAPIPGAGFVGKGLKAAITKAAPVVKAAAKAGPEVKEAMIAAAEAGRPTLLPQLGIKAGGKKPAAALERLGRGGDATKIDPSIAKLARDKAASNLGVDATEAAVRQQAWTHYVIAKKVDPKASMKDLYAFYEKPIIPKAGKIIPEAGIKEPWQMTKAEWFKAPRGIPDAPYANYLREMDSVIKDTKSYFGKPDELGERLLTPMAQNRIIERSIRAFDEGVIREPELYEVVGANFRNLDIKNPFDIQEVVDYYRGKVKLSPEFTPKPTLMTETEVTKLWDSVFGETGIKKQPQAKPIITPAETKQAFTVGRQLERQTLQQEGLALTDNVELDNFILDYARLARGEPRLADMEVARLSGVLTKNIRAFMERYKQGTITIDNVKVVEDLRKALKNLRDPARVNKVFGIEEVVHLSHVTDPNVLPLIFRTANLPTGRWSAAQKVNKILDYLAGKPTTPAKGVPESAAVKGAIEPAVPAGQAKVAAEKAATVLRDAQRIDARASVTIPELAKSMGLTKTSKELSQIVHGLLQSGDVSIVGGRPLPGKSVYYNRRTGMLSNKLTEMSDDVIIALQWNRENLYGRPRIGTAVPAGQARAVPPVLKPLPEPEMGRVPRPPEEDEMINNIFKQQLLGERRAIPREPSGMPTPKAPEVPSGERAGAGGVPPGPPKPPTALGAGAPQPFDFGASVQKLSDRLKEAKALWPETRFLRREQLKVKAGAQAAIRESETGMSALRKSQAARRGELAKAQFETPNIFTEQEKVAYLDAVRQNAEVQHFDWTGIGESIADMIDHNKVPIPSEIKAIERAFGLKAGSFRDSRKFRLALEVLGIPKALRATADVSAFLRQGGALITRKEFWKNIGPSLKALKNEEYAQALDKAIRNSPNFEMSQSFKVGKRLSITERGPSARLLQREEPYMTGLPQRVPVLGAVTKASERHYVTFLNKLRWDTWNNAVEAWQKSGMTKAEIYDHAEKWADFVNKATGRGNLGDLAKSPTLMATLNFGFFSPRFVASRLQLPLTLLTKDKVIRGMVARELVKDVGVGLTALGVVVLAGGKVELDPRSTDFGKGRIGNTRFDFWAGFQQPARYVAQLITGQRKAASGQIEELNRLQTFYRFAQSKEAPVSGLITSLLDNKTFIGEPLTVGKVAVSLLVPMLAENLYEAIQEEGPMKGTMFGVTGAAGLGVQSYPAPYNAWLAKYPETVRLNIPYGRVSDKIGDHQLTPDERAQLQTRTNELAEAAIRVELATKWYQNATDENRKIQLGLLLDDARARARAEFEGGQPAGGRQFTPSGTVPSGPNPFLKIPAGVR